MSRPRYGHLCGRLYFDNGLADGMLWRDEDDLTASESTWQMLFNSDTVQQVCDWVRFQPEGEHRVPQQFIRPFEVHPSVQGLGEFARVTGRSSLNTVTCPSCGGGETRLRRWFAGQSTVWWCDECVRPVPTLRLVG